MIDKHFNSIATTQLSSQQQGNTSYQLQMFTLHHKYYCTSIEQYMHLRLYEQQSENVYAFQKTLS